MPIDGEVKRIKLINRSWDKMDLYRVFSEREFRVGAEIGVYNGEFSSTLWNCIPTMKLYLIDPYIKYEDEAIRDSQGVHDRRYEMVKQIVSEHNGVLLRMKSQDALSLVTEPLDFVFIDGDHATESVKFDIENWSKKVRPGGMVCGHDYDLQHPDIIRTVWTSPGLRELYIFGADSIWLFEKREAE